MTKRSKGKQTLEDLRQMAMKQGFITIEQIEGSMDLETNIDLMDEVYIMLGKMKVEVFDSEKDAVEKLRKVAEELFEKLPPQKDHYADEPPEATTGDALPMGTAATLTGILNARGQETTYSFQYGTTKDYGSATEAKSAGAGTEDIAVEETLADLTPTTTYHYRLVATSAGGETKGDDREFTTEPP